jgi:pimeloyl-ACP methyl ester carboxylesterase
MDQTAKTDLLPRQAVTNGVPVRWLEQADDDGGRGVPAVLIHGIPTGPLLWRYVVPHLAGTRCLAFEMVGYADSIPAGRGRDISVGRQADYLLGWLDEIGVRRAVLVGHDLGGGVAQIAAVRRPEVCAGIVLTNAIGYDSWPIPSVKAMQRTATALERLPTPAVRAALLSLFLRGHDNRARAQEALAVHSRPYLQHDGMAALVRQVRSLHTYDTLAVARELPRLDVPARVVWGAADAFQKVRYGEQFATDLGAPLRRIPGGKHFTPEDHPEEVAAAVRDVLREVA